jgi:ankyrin repeat protein
MRIIPNTFTTFELSQDEQVAGHILNETTRAVIQNHLAQVSELKINLNPNLSEPNYMQSFIQQQAYYEGQISTLRWLLDAHESCVKANQKATNEVVQVPEGRVLDNNSF